MKVLAFGEILLRLSADDIDTNSSFDYCCGGTEANVLCCLSGMGLDAKYLSVLPKDKIGAFALAKLNEYRVDTSSVIVKDGNMGEYYLFAQEKDRAKATVYNRRNSAFAHIDESDVDFEHIFDDVGWFHVSGISFAVSPSAERVAFRLLRSARERGIPTSFDFNYRPALWTTDQAGATFRKLLRYVDVISASTKDMQVFLGLQDDFVNGFFSLYPDAKYLFLRDRLDDKKGEVGVMRVVAASHKETIALDGIKLRVKERIGGGDAFDAGVIYGLFTHDDLSEALELGISSYILKHQVAGDILNAPYETVASYYDFNRILKDPTILLSVGEMDASFERMRSVLSNFATVRVCGLNDVDLSDVDVFIGKKLSAATLATANRLKAIFAYKTGVDDFPLKELAQKDILLCNSHVNSDYIAEYAFGLAITLVNQICIFDKKLRKGEWNDENYRYWKSIFDMKIGLLGYGDIGKQIHKILMANDIETYTIDRGKPYHNVRLVKDFKELCQTCDLIISSLPKTPDTDDIFNKESFEWLRDKFIVNVGRSNVLNEKDLYDALKNNVIAGIANDVWKEKPKNKSDLLMPSKYNLQEFDNVVLSPHRAMFVMDGHDRYVQDVTQNVIDYIQGRAPQNVVDCTKGY